MTGPAGTPERNEVVLRSEFAAVRVARDDVANGPRLRVEDLRSGQTIFLDPLELEWLAWSDHNAILHLMPDAARASHEHSGGTE